MPFFLSLFVCLWCMHICVPREHTLWQICENGNLCLPRRMKSIWWTAFKIERRSGVIDEWRYVWLSFSKSIHSQPHMTGILKKEKIADVDTVHVYIYMCAVYIYTPCTCLIICFFFLFQYNVWSLCMAFIISFQICPYWNVAFVPSRKNIYVSVSWLVSRALYTCHARCTQATYWSQTVVRAFNFNWVNWFFSISFAYTCIWVSIPEMEFSFLVEFGDIILSSCMEIN